MTDTQRTILEDVAAGRLSPEEAAARLGRAPGQGPRRSQPPPPGSSPTVRSVQVRAAARTVRVVGDPMVAEVAAEGLHQVHREGDTLVVTAHRRDDAGGGGSFAFVGPDLGWLARRAWSEAERRGRGRGRAWPRGEWPPPPWGRPDWRDWHRLVEPLVVRVNPSLAVEADVSAGSLTVSGLLGPLEVDVSAGSAALEDVGGPVTVRAQAASVRLRGRLDTGASSIRCDAGSVSVTLEPGSDVKVTARAELGRVRVGPAGEDWALGQTTKDLVVGAGRASLDIEATMGAIDVRAAGNGAGGPAQGSVDL